MIITSNFFEPINKFVENGINQYAQSNKKQHIHKKYFDFETDVSILVPQNAHPPKPLLSVGFKFLQ